MLPITAKVAKLTESGSLFNINAPTVLTNRTVAIVPPWALDKESELISSRYLWDKLTSNHPPTRWCISLKWACSNQLAAFLYSIVFAHLQDCATSILYWKGKCCHSRVTLSNVEVARRANKDNSWLRFIVWQVVLNLPNQQRTCQCKQ